MAAAGHSENCRHHCRFGGDGIQGDCSYACSIRCGSKPNAGKRKVVYANVILQLLVVVQAVMRHLFGGQNGLTLSLGQLKRLFLKLVREVQQLDQVTLAEQLKLLGRFGLVVAQQGLPHANQLLYRLSCAFAHFRITQRRHHPGFARLAALVLVCAAMAQGEPVDDVGVEHDRGGLAIQGQTVA